MGLRQSSQDAAFLKPPPEASPTDVPLVPLMLEDGLRELLADAFPDTEEALLEMGFQRWVDAHERSEHHYVEGYFHALTGNYGREVPSVHPRLGLDLMRASAPLALFAFCEAFRRQNAPLFKDLTKDLSRKARPLSQVFKRTAYLSDLAVQVHWGEAVSEKDMFWHVDAANSFLHMAIAVQGNRTLHAKRGLQSGCQPEALHQAPGSVYMSVPCCFPHAVEYPTTTWESRIIAVQCRLLLDQSEMFTPGLDIDPRGAGASCMFQHLRAMAAGSLLTPDLESVTSLMRELSAHQQ
mmetsp:Transcript_19027/g.44393  ORF Transcript_19027/g.44393 Transcript_19027/m.44393 type:complete len:294 (+) Transcript_19027:47-928(+)